MAGKKRRRKVDTRGGKGFGVEGVKFYRPPQSLNSRASLYISLINSRKLKATGVRSTAYLTKAKISDLRGF